MGISLTDGVSGFENNFQGKRAHLNVKISDAAADSYIDSDNSKNKWTNVFKSKSVDYTSIFLLFLLLNLKQKKIIIGHCASRLSKFLY